MPDFKILLDRKDGLVRKVVTPTLLNQVTSNNKTRKGKNYEVS